MTIGNTYTLRVDNGVSVSNSDLFVFIDELDFPMRPLQKFAFNYTVFTSVSAPGAGIKFSLIGTPGMVFFGGSCQYYDTFTGSLVGWALMTDGGLFDIPTAQLQGVLQISGSCYNGAVTGNMQLEFAQSVPMFDPTDVLRGSFLTINSL